MKTESVLSNEESTETAAGGDLPLVATATHDYSSVEEHTLIPVHKSMHYVDQQLQYKP